jgi:hypothetical protein
MGQTAAQGDPGCRVFTLPVSAAWVYRWWGWVDLFASRLIAIRELTWFLITDHAVEVRLSCPTRVQV